VITMRKKSLANQVNIILACGLLAVLSILIEQDNSFANQTNPPTNPCDCGTPPPSSMPGYTVLGWVQCSSDNSCTHTECVSTTALNMYSEGIVDCIKQHEQVHISDAKDGVCIDGYLCLTTCTLYKSERNAYWKSYLCALIECLGKGNDSPCVKYRDSQLTLFTKFDDLYNSQCSPTPIPDPTPTPTPVPTPTPTPPPSI